MNKKNVAVLFGGASTEHEVSRRSAVSVMKNLDETKYNILPIGITKQGEWYIYLGDINKIFTGEWEKDIQNKKSAVVSPDAKTKGLLVFDGDKFEKIALDVIVPVLHGRNGEDGTVQGLFELAGIPYVGCGVLASAACMDKIFTNIVLTSAGIEKAKFAFIYRHDFENRRDEALSYIEQTIGSYPMFVKPSNAGSSVGISKAKTRSELVDAINLALEHDHRILIEESIVGQEVECAVLGNNEPIASTIGEIEAANEFYDYEAKYVSDSGLFIPAHIDESLFEKIKNIAKKAYLAMGCRGLSRVDFFVEKGTGRILLNEINTLPGFTSISMYPKLMADIGIETPNLLDKLIALAEERFQTRER